MKNIKILFFDRIDVSQETDVNKTSASKECAICLNWYFLNKCLKFKPNDVINLLMISMNHVY